MVGLYFGAAEVGTRIAIEAEADPAPGEVDVYLVSNGVHVDVWVPAVRAERDWTKWLPREVPLRRSGYVAFGWGDRRFFLEVPTWDDLTADVAIQGALWPTPSAVHVTAYPGPPGADDRVHRLRITRAQYASLVDHVDRAFELDDGGRPELLDHPGYHHSDRFFAGRGSYHLFRTCNVWTNEAVKVMGQKAALWAPFERGARFHLPRNRGER
ncbi:MAG: TIGR02117 family protein [Planctomycetota bacterium]